MTKIKRIIAILAIFAIVGVGTITLTMSAANDKFSDVKRTNNTMKANETVTRNSTMVKAQESIVPNTVYHGKVTQLDTWTTSDANLVWFESEGNSYIAIVKPDTGNLGLMIWMLLNSAQTSSQYVDLYIDSDGYISQVTLYPCK